MHQFEIWAPAAATMAVKLSESVVPMQGPDEEGWWRVSIDAAGPGTEYKYLVDDDKNAYPDPRSLSQPNGVHGPSRVYDQSAFAWKTTKFQPPPLSSAIVYEIHIGTFTHQGTFDAAIDRLDHLVALGVSHVEVMPVAAFPGDHGWGYDGVALFAVQEAYGGPDGLKRFVDAAHGKGLAVLLDVVYNHFGPVGNYTGKYGPYVVDTHHTPWGAAVNFEGPWSHQVRQFFIDNALMWMREFHIDGLRLDAVHAYIDRSAVHFLEQLSSETKTLEATLGRSLVLIAESDLNDPRLVTPREAGGFGLDAQWSDDFHHALFAALTPDPPGGYYSDFGSLDQLAQSLEQTFVYGGIYSKYRKRAHGRPAGPLSQHRFLGYIQNHDQVGNRAVGERLQVSVGFNRAKIAAALVLLGPFVPMLFQGEEWAASSPFQYFAHHEDPQMIRLVSEGRKKEFAAFGWSPDLIPDPEKRETFERSKLHWDELVGEQHSEMLSWYRDLIRLRRSIASLNNGEPGNTTVDYDAEGMWLNMQRGEISVLCNLGKSAHTFAQSTGAVLRLASCGNLTMRDASVTVPPDAVAVVRLSSG
jgi:maltooligosyltrehalose trehalohydrolase